MSSCPPGEHSGNSADNARIMSLVYLMERIKHRSLGLVRDVGHELGQDHGPRAQEDRHHARGQHGGGASQAAPEHAPVRRSAYLQISKSFYHDTMLSPI